MIYPLCTFNNDAHFVSGGYSRTAPAQHDARRPLANSQDRRSCRVWAIGYAATAGGRGGRKSAGSAGGSAEIPPPGSERAMRHGGGSRRLLAPYPPHGTSRVLLRRRLTAAHTDCGQAGDNAGQNRRARNRGPHVRPRLSRRRETLTRLACRAAVRSLPEPAKKAPRECGWRRSSGSKFGGAEARRPGGTASLTYLPCTAGIRIPLCKEGGPSGYEDPHGRIRAATPDERACATTGTARRTARRRPSLRHGGQPAGDRGSDGATGGEVK